MQLVFELSVYR